MYKCSSHCSSMRKDYWWLCTGVRGEKRRRKSTDIVQKNENTVRFIRSSHSFFKFPNTNQFTSCTICIRSKHVWLCWLNEGKTNDTMELTNEYVHTSGWVEREQQRVRWRKSNKSRDEKIKQINTKILSVAAFLACLRSSLWLVFVVWL